MATPAEIRRHIVEPTERIFNTKLTGEGVKAYEVGLKSYAAPILIRAWGDVIRADQEPHVDVIREACERYAGASHLPSLELKPPRDWQVDAKLMAAMLLEDFDESPLAAQFADRPHNLAALRFWAEEILRFHTELLSRAAVLGYKPVRNSAKYRALYLTDQTIEAGEVKLWFPDRLIETLEEMVMPERHALWFWWYHHFASEQGE